MSHKKGIVNIRITGEREILAKVIVGKHLHYKCDFSMFWAKLMKQTF